jgi:hypothetical protein
LRPRRLHVYGKRFFCGLHFLLRRQARLLYRSLALFECAAARSFLLGKNFRTSLSQGLLIRAEPFLRGGTRALRLLPGTLGPRTALSENTLHGPEKTPPEEEIKKKNDDDGRDSRQEQSAELVQYFHVLKVLASTVTRLGASGGILAAHTRPAGKSTRR